MWCKLNERQLVVFQRNIQMKSKTETTCGHCSQVLWEKINYSIGHLYVTFYQVCSLLIGSFHHRADKIIFSFRGKTFWTDQRYSLNECLGITFALLLLLVIYHRRRYVKGTFRLREIIGLVSSSTALDSIALQHTI